MHTPQPTTAATRSLLLQQIELAARVGDLARCRKLIREADAASTAFADAAEFSYRRAAISTIAAYWLYNATASAFAYRLVKDVAEAEIAQDGVGASAVTFRMKSWSTRGAVTLDRPSASPADHVMGMELETGRDDDVVELRTLPLLYLSDLFTGRSEWAVRANLMRNGALRWTSKMGSWTSSWQTAPPAA